LNTRYHTQRHERGREILNFLNYQKRFSLLLWNHLMRKFLWINVVRNFTGICIWQGNTYCRTISNLTTANTTAKTTTTAAIANNYLQQQSTYQHNSTHSSSVLKYSWMLFTHSQKFMVSFKFFLTASFYPFEDDLFYVWSLMDAQKVQSLEICHMRNISQSSEPLFNYSPRKWHRSKFFH